MSKKSLKKAVKKPTYIEPTEAQWNKAEKCAEKDGYRMPLSYYLGETDYRSGGIRRPM